ncbi:MAG TPA: Trx7/PDZ domain-containing (seleno)protein [Pirellulales bacterium]|nr:Trx7/PDZ domain-containing (seleno)protein [Pirellulales bacterium]
MPAPPVRSCPGARSPKLSRAERALPWLAAVLFIASVAGAAPPSEREVKVRGDKARFENDESWVYNDWQKAVAEARQTGKPLLVVLRCVPCEACSKFDDELVRRVDEVRELMDRFVCARIVTANGLDLDLFQYDYDQSFHAFLMNADGTIYGRFGTRSESRDETQDMTMRGFRRALELALAWHKEYPANKSLFAAKRGPKPLVARPEDYPAFKGKYASRLSYEGNVVQSCIHCHQVREAERLFYRDQGKPLPEDVLYPYPLPKVVGLTMNALEAAEVKSVADGSPAATAGFEPGDRIASLAGEPLLSIADLQWVLHRAGSSDALPAVVERGGKAMELTLDLPSGWRAKSDLSWRPTSWDLRRMAFGGIRFDPLSADDRREMNIPDGALALLAKHVGEYGEHAAAKRAGFRKGDVLVEYDGSRAPRTETEIMARALNEQRPGDKTPVKVLRGGKEISLEMPVQ